MSLFIERPGILTTIQDMGRPTYRRLGINPGGAMDRRAARLANLLVCNDERAPLLEMHFPAARIKFSSDCTISICGADLGAEIDGERFEPWRTIRIKNGDVLGFKAKLFGSRAYLAVAGGGFVADEWLGSRSTNLAAGLGGFAGRRLKAGDVIELARPDRAVIDVPPRWVSPSLVPVYRPFPTVRVIAGAEFENLDDRGRERFFEQDFRISSRSDRMGFRLEGEPIKLALKHRFISSAVNFGTIQLLPDGQLIVLMADHQTAGGYPRIGHIITHDRPLIAQLGAGDKLAFHLISIGEAERLHREYESELNLMRIAARFGPGV